MPKWSESLDYCPNCSHRTELAKATNEAEALEWAIFAIWPMWCESCQIRIFPTE